MSVFLDLETYLLIIISKLGLKIKFKNTQKNTFMTYENFTVNAQEAILKSQQLAGSLEQQGVDTIHLIKGIPSLKAGVIKTSATTL